MENNYNSQLDSFLLPFSQANYNFMQFHSLQSSHIIQNEIKPLQIGPNLQSIPGKGKWTLNQQRLYIVFVTLNIQDMREKSTRKSNKVFLNMSRQVKTRTADQCRSHHQKALKYHKSLQEIIRYYTKEIYSSESFFGYNEAIQRKQAVTKTTVQQENIQSANFVPKDKTFKLVLDVQQMADY